MNFLFLFEPVKPTDTCNTCTFRQPTHCGSKIIQYCDARISNRTLNGKLKIKCKTQSCQLYERIKK